MFKNRVLTKIYGSKKEEVTEGDKKLYTISSFIICIPHHLLLGDEVKGPEMVGTWGFRRKT